MYFQIYERAIDLINCARRVESVTIRILKGKGDRGREVSDSAGLPMCFFDKASDAEGLG